jgi:tetratricopeptide (TPR) repeat protein
MIINLQKKTLVLIILICSAAVTFAQQDESQVQVVYPETPNLYAEADNATIKLISNVDDLVAKKQYATAFNTLGADNDNPFIIAKKIDFCIENFVGTNMYQSFTFKDLSQDETLDSARDSHETLPEIAYDPVKIVTDYETKNGDSGILDKALGDYYMSCYRYFGENWLIPEKDIFDKASNYYQSALTKNYFDVQSLKDFALCLLHLEKYQDAENILNKELQYTQDSDAHYYLAIACIYQNNYDQGAAEGEKAIALYDSDPNIKPEVINTYKADAYLLCADAALYAEKFDKAIDYTNKVLEYVKGDYRAYDEFISIYLAEKDFTNASLYADKLFAIAPESPSATQMVFKKYYGTANDELEKFFTRNIQTYNDNPSVLGNLYYHLAYLYYSEQKKDESVNAAHLCRDNYTKSQEYEGNTKDAVDSLISACEQ